MTYTDARSYPGNDAQKPVTEAMLCEPHGRHNYHEYRHVLTVSSGSAEGIHFWARYGLLRTLHRNCSWFHAALRFNSSHLAADEYEQGLDYLRTVDPLRREFFDTNATIEAFVLAITDYAAIERLLEQPADADQDVVHWAWRGVILGLESWRHMATMILAGKMEDFAITIPGTDLKAFMQRSKGLLELYKAAGAGQ
ncbi:hypothetical protein [Pseudomonas serbica]|uniref:hypothetical protein n=1 Tax=Pseudomonas serbica TaxID=2965074 RepID=UPI00237B29E9|nr:hypothetical protein [Pseudomonas serbica]